MEGNIWQLLAGFVAAMGIPSAIMGLIVWRLEGRISKRERDHEEQDKSQKDLIVLLVQTPAHRLHLGKQLQKRCSVFRMHIVTVICTQRSSMRLTSNTNRRSS